MRMSRTKFALLGLWLALLAYCVKIVLHYPAPLAPLKCLLACVIGFAAFFVIHLGLEKYAPDFLSRSGATVDRPGRPAGALRFVLALSCLALFALPLLTGAAQEWFGWHYDQYDLKKLYGVYIAKDEPQASADGLFEGKFQEKFSNYFNENFALRPLFIKLNNQLFYDLFDTSYMYDKAIVVGKQRQLYEENYILFYYNIANQTQPGLADIYAKQLRDLQDLLAGRGISFLLLISPNKAATYPEYIPEQFKWFRRTGKLNRQVLLPLLRKHGVNFYDAQEAMDTWRKKQPIPLFCQGGTHWNDLGALYSLQGMLAELERISGKKLVKLRLDDVAVDNNPTGYDRDLAELLNLYYQPYDFPSPHPKVTPVRDEETFTGNLALVGGSFNWIILDLMHKYGVFDRMDFYYYYHTFFRRYEAGKPAGEKTTVDVWHMNWDKRIFNKDFVIIEMNSAVIPFGNYPSAFIKGAFDNSPKQNQEAAAPAR